MYNLTGIYWIRNEARYIPEYVEFHLLQGFDHFIFYDQNSDDNLLEIIEPYISAGLVEIRYYPPHVPGAKNFWISEQCCRDQKGKSKWIHYHSIDERIFCPDGRQIPELLKEYEDVGGLCVAWNEFNSSGHEKRPAGLIIENFTMGWMDPMCHIKTIVQPEFSTKFNGNPHNFYYTHGRFGVTENRNHVPIAHSPGDYTYNKIRNHHYRTLSREEFEAKMNKGILDHGAHLEGKRREQAEDEWSYCHQGPSRWGYIVEPRLITDLVKYTDVVRAALKERYKGKEHLLEFINH